MVAGGIKRGRHIKLIIRQRTDRQFVGAPPEELRQNKWNWGARQWPGCFFVNHGYWLAKTFLMSIEETSRLGNEVVLID